MQWHRSALNTALILVVLVFHPGVTAAPEGLGPASRELSRDQIESLLQTLEDPQRREQVIATLRALAEATDKTADTGEPETVKTAAAEFVELLAAQIAEISASTSRLVEAAQRLPGLLASWQEALRDPDARRGWLMIGWRLVVVLGAGFAAALAVAALLRRIRTSAGYAGGLSLVTRVSRLIGHLILDLVPIIAFAVTAYVVLALVDPRQETRLVAVALINASILSRLVLAGSAFLMAPGAPQLRLWQVSDESAQYVHQWVKRLAFIMVYGFFGLQAGLLLGLDVSGYRMLLRLLGLVIVGMLLVLIAQNRADVAKAIASERAADVDEPAPLSSFRKALARVWHLLAGLYLIVIYAIWSLQVKGGAQYVVRATLLSLLVLAVGRLLARAINHVFDRGLRLSSDLRASYPRLEQRLNRYFPVLRKIMKLALAAILVLTLASAWGVDALQWLTEGSGKILLAAVLNILLILGVALVLWEFASGGIERYLAESDQDGRTHARSPRIKTLLTVARNALMVLLSVVATLMVLSQLGINIAPLLAGAGVVGLAIGFGAQRLVQDVINGAFILFQDLMAVGDVVKLGDKAGVVEALSIRTVRLRDLAGIVHTIPFSSIEGVSNLTREFSFHVFDLGIAYREDVDSVIELIKQIGEELRADPEVGPLILEPLEVFGLDAFGDSAIMIKGRIKTQPIKQWQVGRAFNRLVKKHFDELGIEIPFPHRTLYFGQDKNGAAPPAFVQLESLLRDAAPGSPMQGSTQMPRPAK